MLFTLDAQQTLNLFEHSQVYRQAAEHLRTFLNRVRNPYSARASVYTNRASIREQCSQTIDTVPTMAPGLSKLSICAASIVILPEIEKRPHRKKRRMWESSFLKGRNYVQLLANLKADDTYICCSHWTRNKH